MRLNVFIAKTGLSSRRKATDLIKEGRVKVGGKVVPEPWYVIRKGDAISVNGKLLSAAEKNLYFVVNKPKGVTSTVEDAHALKKVTDILPKKYSRLYPVGRLDKNSRGLIILTNDGDLCYNLTHPKFEIEKEYAVTVKGLLDANSLKRIKDGVFSEGDVLKVKAYQGVKKCGDRTALHVVITEGKKRHLRRLFKSLGNPVIDLKRVRIGGLLLGDLREGGFAKIDEKTIYHMALNKDIRSIKKEGQYGSSEKDARSG